MQDPLLLPIGKPYKLLPKLNVTAARADMPFGAVFSVQGEGAAFRHETLLEGNRYTLYPQVALPLQFSGLAITPKIGFNTTKYRFDSPPIGTPDQISRSVPITSVDSTMVFERDVEWTKQTLIQTLEPRVYYLYVPNRARRPGSPSLPDRPIRDRTWSRRPTGRPARAGCG